MALLEVPALVGRLVRLEPLGVEHASDLAVAAEEDRSTYGFTVVPRAEEIDAYIRDQQERSEAGLTAFAQIRMHDERAVGCTAYWNPRTWEDHDELCAIEIGWTWLAASAQGTGINAEAKLMLLRHAFETLGVVRVDFKTDARNARSRKAITDLGAVPEGVLRRWSPSRAPGEEGLLRDSAMFSILDSEWPAVEASLRRRLGT